MHFLFLHAIFPHHCHLLWKQIWLQGRIGQGLFVCISCLFFIQIRSNNADIKFHFWKYHRKVLHTQTLKGKLYKTPWLYVEISSWYGTLEWKIPSLLCISAQFSHKNFSWRGISPCVCEQLWASVCVLTGALKHKEEKKKNYLKHQWEIVNR